MNTKNFNIDQNGNVTLSGNINAIGGKIGNINIASNAIYSGSKTSYNNSNTGFYLGSDGKFGLGTDTTGIIWDGTNLNLKVSSLLIGGETAATQKYTDDAKSSAINTAAGDATSKANSAAQTATNYLYYNFDSLAETFRLYFTIIFDIIQYFTNIFTIEKYFI